MLLSGTIGTVPIDIIDGDRSSKYPKRSEFVESGVPFFNSTVVIDGQIVSDGMNYISEIKAASITKGVVKPSDTVLTTRGSIGKVGWIKPEYSGAVINAQMLIMRSASEEIDARYLYYVMRSPDMQAKMVSFSSGSAQPQIPIRDLKAIPVSFPALPIQRRIAGILSAYDDLIEVNTRRIKALEKMARLAYASLHSDEYEMFSSNSLVTKKISGDWGKEQPTDTHSMPVSIIRGTDFKNLEVGNYSTVPTRWVRPIDLERKQLMPMDLVVENSVNAKSRHCGTPLLINNHMLNALGGKVVCASFCRGFRFGKKVHATSMKYWFQEIRENGEISQYQNIAANGIANFQSTIFMEKAKCKIIIDEHPAANLMNDANTGVYRAQLSNLRAQRDLLLPRLVSGAIDVLDAEHTLEAAAE